MRPDPLDGLSLAQRLRREKEDLMYLASLNNVEMVSSAAGLKKDSTRYLGLDATAAALGVKPWKGKRVDVGIGSRLDLNHPLHFEDNILLDCADCGCRLQHRTAAPRAKEWVCVSCAARRVREQEFSDQAGTKRVHAEEVKRGGEG